MGRGPKRAGGAGLAIREVSSAGSINSKQTPSQDENPASKDAPRSVKSAPRVTKREAAKSEKAKKIQKGLKYAGVAASPAVAGTASYRKYKKWNEDQKWKNSSWGQATAHHYGVNEKGKVNSIPLTMAAQGMGSAAAATTVAASFGTPLAPVTGLAVGGTAAFQAASIWNKKRKIEAGKMKANLKYDEHEAKLEKKAFTMEALALMSGSKTMQVAFGATALKRENDLRKYRKERDTIPKEKRRAKKKT